MLMTIPEQWGGGGSKNRNSRMVGDLMQNSFHAWWGMDIFWSNTTAIASLLAVSPIVVYVVYDCILTEYLDLEIFPRSYHSIKILASKNLLRFSPQALNPSV